MYQLILLIPSSIDIIKFDKEWPRFLEAVEDMPGLVSESLTRVDQQLFGQSQYSRIYSFNFPDKETLENSLLSTEGEIAGKMIHSLTGGRVILLTGEYRGDSIDNIKAYHQSQSNKKNQAT